MARLAFDKVVQRQSSCDTTSGNDLKLVMHVDEHIADVGFQFLVKRLEVEFDVVLLEEIVGLGFQLSDPELRC